MKTINTTFCMMIALIMFVSSCSSSNSNNVEVAETNETERFEAGEIGYFTDNCIGVVDDDDMELVMKYVRANDMAGIRTLVAARKATTFAAGKRVKIIEIGFEYVQVRDIDASELLVWVPKNMLTHEDIYHVYTNENQ